jgi:hypothetical protein
MSSVNTRINIALNSNTPVEVLEVLSTDEDFVVRCNVANNPNTPVEVLKVLSTDKHYWVRCAVAGNPNTPVEVLEVLSTDEDYDVRHWVAENPNSKIHTKRYNQKATTLRDILENYNLPSCDIETICEDFCLKVIGPRKQNLSYKDGYTYGFEDALNLLELLSKYKTIND